MDPGKLSGIFLEAIKKAGKVNARGRSGAAAAAAGGHDER